MKLYQKALLLGAGIAMSASSAMAAFTFTNGDLILGFQATGGQGSNQNVFFNLGAGTSFRDGTNPTSLGNISTTLSLVFGANWSDRQDVYFGIVGNLNSQPTTGIGSVSPVNGDPSRTFYLSSATDTPGSALAWAGYNSSSLGTAGVTLAGMETMIIGLNTEADGAAILNQTTQPVAWNNGWTVHNPTPGGSLGTFGGGVQQNFGGPGTTDYLDLQRLVSTNTGATPAGIPGTGVYLTTIGIDSAGNISAIPEASTSLLAAAATGLLVLRRRRA